jgi:hypothetical protein
MGLLGLRVSLELVEGVLESVVVSVRLFWSPEACQWMPLHHTQLELWKQVGKLQR